MDGFAELFWNWDQLRGWVRWRNRDVVGRYFESPNFIADRRYSENRGDVATKKVTLPVVCEHHESEIRHALQSGKLRPIEDRRRVSRIEWASRSLSTCRRLRFDRNQ